MPSQSLQGPQDPWEDQETLPRGLPRFTKPPFVGRSSCPQGVEGQSPSSEDINHSNRLVTRAPHTGQLMKAGAHRNRPAPRLTQGPGYPPGMAPPLSQVLSGCPITASGALGPPRGLAKPRPGPANSPFLGARNPSLLSGVLGTGLPGLGPDRDRRGDSPAWSGRGSRPSRRTSG